MRLPPHYIFDGYTFALLQRSGFAVHSARRQHAALGHHYVRLFSLSRSAAASYQALIPELGLPLYGDYVLT